MDDCETNVTVTAKNWNLHHCHTDSLTRCAQFTPEKAS